MNMVHSQRVRACVVRSRAMKAACNLILWLLDA